jgi:hypothetical protein
VQNNVLKGEGVRGLSSLIFVVLFSFIVLVNVAQAQCNNPLLQKSLENTKASALPAVTQGSTAVIYLDTATNIMQGVQYTATDAQGHHFTGAFNTVSGLVEINVGVIDSEKTFTIKAEKGGCSYTLPTPVRIKAVTTPQLSVRIVDEYCKKAGGFLAQVVGTGENADDYNYSYKKASASAFINTYSHTKALEAGDYEIKAVHKTDPSKTFGPTKIHIENRTQVPMFDLQERISLCQANKASVVVNVTRGNFPMTYKLYYSEDLRTPIKTQVNDNLFTDLDPNRSYTIGVADFCGASGNGEEETKAVNSTKLKGAFSITNMSPMQDPYVKNIGKCPGDKLYFIVNADFVALNDKGTRLYGSPFGEDGYLLKNDNVPYPLTLSMLYTSPSGKTYSETIVMHNKKDVERFASNGLHTSMRFDTYNMNSSVLNNVPHEKGKWTLKHTLTDGCGKVYTGEQQKEVTAIDRSLGAGMQVNADNCTGMRFSPSSKRTVDIALLSYPSCFKPENNGFYRKEIQGKVYPNVKRYVQGQSVAFISDAACQGEYVFQFIDECGNSEVVTKTVTLSGTSFARASVTSYGVCDALDKQFIAKVSLSGSTFKQVEVLNDDGSLYSNVATQTAEANGATQLLYVTLPVIKGGKYKLRITPQCGNVETKEVQADGADLVAHWELKDCKLSVTLKKRDNRYPVRISTEKYILQYYDENTNTWGAIEKQNDGSQAYKTGGYEEVGTYVGDEGLTKELPSQYEMAGKYRVAVIVYQPYRTNDKCITTLSEYNFGERIKAERVYKLSCSDGAYYVAVVASGGFPPYTYEIIAIGGDNVTPIASTNGNFFLKLPAKDGTPNKNPNVNYRFSVRDKCGKSATIDAVVNGMPNYVITADLANYCQGGKAVLSVPELGGAGFATYQWYREDAPSNILSTSNVLTITTLTAEDFTHKYKVRVQPTDPNVDLCLDSELAYQLVKNPNAKPSKLIGKTLPICSGDLETKISTEKGYRNYDLRDLFEVENITEGKIIDLSGQLQIKNFKVDLTQTLIIGNRTFQYIGVDACGNQVKATATITVSQSAPTVKFGNNNTIALCNDANITYAEIEQKARALFGNLIPNATLSWYKEDRNKNIVAVSPTDRLLMLNNPQNVYFTYSNAGFNCPSGYTTLKISQGRLPNTLSAKQYDICGVPTVKRIAQQIKEDEGYANDTSLAVKILKAGQSTALPDEYELTDTEHYTFYFANSGSEQCKTAAYTLQVQSTRGLDTYQPVVVSESAATCTDDEVLKISNYVVGYTYIFTQAGVTDTNVNVATTGVISGLTAGLSYKVQAKKGNCLSVLSENFQATPAQGGANLIVPAQPKCIGQNIKVGEIKDNLAALNGGSRTDYNVYEAGATTALGNDDIIDPTKQYEVERSHTGGTCPSVKKPFRIKPQIITSYNGEHTTDSFCKGTTIADLKQTIATAEHITINQIKVFDTVIGAEVGDTTPLFVTEDTTPYVYRYQYQVIDNTGTKCDSDRRDVRVRVVGADRLTQKTSFCGSEPVSIVYATYNITGIGTTIGLPSGVEAKYNPTTKRIEIAGSTTVKGSYNYTIPLLSSCLSAQITGTLTIGDQQSKKPTTTSQEICGAGTIADLKAKLKLSQPKVFLTPTATIELPDSTPLVNNHTYYITQTEHNKCESAAQGVTVTLKEKTIFNRVIAPQFFCKGDARVDKLISKIPKPAGGTVTLYNSLGYKASGSTALQTGTYYATITESGKCESDKIPIQVTVADLAAPTLSAAIATCDAAGTTVTITNYDASLIYEIIPQDGVTLSDATISNMKVGTIYTLTVGKGYCTASTANIKAAPQLAKPAKPILSITPATCTQTTQVKVTNRDATPGVVYKLVGGANLTVLFDGTVKDLNAGTGYRIAVSNKGCESDPSDPFDVVVNTIPAAPTLSVTQPTCGVPAKVLITNYDPNLTYWKDGSQLTISGTGQITGLSTGANQRIKARNAAGCESPLSNSFYINSPKNKPAKPTLIITPANCTSATKIRITNRAVGIEYRIGTTILTLDSMGNVTNALAIGTNKQVIARDNAAVCTSEPSDPFDIEAKKAAPLAPNVTTNVPTCEHPTQAKISNYEAGLTYLSGTTTLTVAPDGTITGLSVGTHTIKARNAAGCQSAPSNSFTIAPQKPTPTAPTVRNLTECPAGSGYFDMATLVTPTGGNTLRWYTTQTATTYATQALINKATITSKSVEKRWVSQVNTEGCESPRAEVTYTIDDTEAPELTAPTPLVVDCKAANLSTQISNWLTTATATDNCSSPTITHNYNSVKPADWCATGVVTVTFIAKDPFGNTTTKTSTIRTLSIDAVDDTHTTPINGTTGATDVIDALANDSFNGNQATTANVTISVVKPATGTTVPTLNTTTGKVSVPAGTASGTYTIVYKITGTVGSLSVSDTATITVHVQSTPITALPDLRHIPNGADGGTVTNVLTNDDLGGNPPTPSTVTITWDSVPNGWSGNPDGTISVPKGTRSGTYTATYTICEKANPTNCATTSVTITVGAPPITATDDNYTFTDTTATRTTGNVLTNDSYNGHTPSTQSVTLSWGTPSGGGLIGNPDGTISVPQGTASGTYTFPYTICGKLNTDNCATATATIIVSGTPTPPLPPTPPAPIPPIAVDDSGNTPINTPINISVLGNDTPNGATTPTVVSQPSNGSVVVNTDGSITYTPNRDYTGTDHFLYEICNASGCATATVSIEVITDIVPYNAISVDGDGVNDYFRIGGIEAYPDNVVRIYNRWGVKVFEVEGYDNVTRVFRGISNGRVTVEAADKLPQGTYYYVIEYVDKHNDRHTKVGWLYVKKNK